MARVTLVFEDVDESNGDSAVAMEAYGMPDEPPASIEELTWAQQLAGYGLGKIKERWGSPDGVESGGVDSEEGSG